jgi:hypothetical protein
MSLDLQRLREKLDNIKNPKKKKFEKKTWPPEQPKPGYQRTIRLIQYPHGNDPFVELFFHYGIGQGQSILCPRLNSGKTCSICEFAFSLKNDGDTESAKKFYPSQRIYAPMIDRGDEKPVVKYWGFGKGIYQQLIEALLSEDYGTFLDPMSGIDADVKWEKKGNSNFLSPTLTFKRKESKLLANEQQIQELLKTIEPIEQVFKPMTPSEINERLNAFVNMDENDGGETVKGAASSDDESEETNATPSVKDLDAAFEEALRDE